MDNAEDPDAVRAELRFEIGLLHERVNALLAAEAFLTIAYTASMSNGAPWGRSFAAVVGPVLAVLGLVLALLAWPGVAATARLVLERTDGSAALLAGPADQPGSTSRRSGRRPAVAAVQLDQRRSLLFFRAVPGVFVAVWSALAVVALVLTW